MLGLALCPLAFPVRLRFVLSPLCFEMAWGGLGFWLEGGKKGVSVFGLKKGLEEKPAPPEAPAKPEKAKNKKKKQEKQKVGFKDLLRIWGHPIKGILLDRVKVLAGRLWAALRLERLLVRYGGGDAYQQGVLAGVFALVPQGARLRLVSDFEGRTNLELEVHLITWKLFGALVLFVATLPYWKAIRLYRELRLT
ncbi:MAG: hypothetical protein A2600_00050 [Candidatus Lambdaproteobacteria bacterium RIFOXYD1_FULL_56_27]|uniref:DUF2953 domain-containing protein n=1 Tax=Candidatus Lambdaproteobacteria bacterium RIFOXYD2_FULL_56_26 TaxID=1817773 RepID=A0A1F6GPK2_9PROT|nr:MAG: hypothetical protein A2557_04170 [Candidatus Lambdaproteobacteria bacterium RIFOXYD2_FULL_56_26]OGH06168.1 MAG: hypothetical protein A2600_00050 [Candidatus Lambdaproteobacteria bacterium RIFOXYD1_FULL_56_27]